jgi:carboxymethylenebutenolidase
MPSESIDIQTPDGVANAILSRPDASSATPHPGVLFLMDAFGLRPRITEMTERIAGRGYVVLAPNLFYRAGRDPLPEMPDMSQPGARERLFGQLRPMMDALTPAALAQDGGAYLQFLELVAPGPVAIAGYCLGARVGWRITAAHPDRVVALAGFHGGGLVTDAPDSPHLSAERLRCEVLFGHADNDGSMTPENIAELDRALDAAGVTHRTSVYEGAAHGYTMSDTPVYDEQASERHFCELFALLERTLPVTGR